MSELRLDNQAVYKAGIILERELQGVLPQVLMQRKPLKWGVNNSIIPLSMDLPKGLTSYKEEIQTEAGKARYLSDYTNDVGSADYSVEENDYRVEKIGHSFHYSIMDLDAAGYASRDIVSRKLQILQYNIEEKAHNHVLFGDAKRKFTGFYNDANVEVRNSGFDPNTATVDQHIQFVTDEIVSYTNKHLLTAGIAGMVVPYTLWSKWQSLRIPDTATPLSEYFNTVFASQSGLTSSLRIIPVNESRNDILSQYMDTADLAAPTFDRIVILPNQIDTVMGVKGFNLEVLPPERQGYHFEVYAYQGFTEFMLYRPTEVVYSDITPVIVP